MYNVNNPLRCETQFLDIEVVKYELSALTCHSFTYNLLHAGLKTKGSGFDSSPVCFMDLV